MKSIVPMYNEKQKQEYIEYDKKNFNNLQNYFRRVSAKEREYQKDITDMNLEELKDTITSLNIRSEISKAHAISLLRGYINWARYYKKTTNGSNAIDNIRAVNIDSEYNMRTQMIKSPESLKEILSCLDYDNYTNRSTRDSLIIWLLYYGMPLDEVQMLKKDELNYATKTVVTGKGKVYKISDEMVELWKKCTEMTTIEKKNGKAELAKNRAVNEYSTNELQQNEYLFPSLGGNNARGHKYVSKPKLFLLVIEVFENYDENLKIPAMNVVYSGMLYKMFMIEESGVEITPEMVAERVGITYQNRHELLTKTRRLRVDYDDWKIAFGYTTKEELAEKKYRE